MNNVTTSIVIGVLVVLIGLFVFFGYLHRPATPVEPKAPVTISQTVATIAPVAAQAPTVYVVKPGDTLSQIAEDQYGSWKAYVKIASVNKIKNPHLIYPGQSIRL